MSWQARQRGYGSRYTVPPFITSLHLSQGLDVARRIALDGDEVGQQSRLDRAEAILHARWSSRPRRGRAQAPPAGFMP